MVYTDERPWARCWATYPTAAAPSFVTLSILFQGNMLKLQASPVPPGPVSFVSTCPVLARVTQVCWGYIILEFLGRLCTQSRERRPGGRVSCREHHGPDSHAATLRQQPSDAEAIARPVQEVPGRRLAPLGVKPLELVVYVSS